MPKERKFISCKWSLKNKFKLDRTLDKYKARLVAKGFTRKESIDYKKTLSLTVKFPYIRVIMTIVVQSDIELRQIDVNKFFKW